MKDQRCDRIARIDTDSGLLKANILQGLFQVDGSPVLTKVNGFKLLCDLGRKILTIWFWFAFFNVGPAMQRLIYMKYGFTNADHDERSG